MSKRAASETITKEHGSVPNLESQESKVKMATAAQQAKRRIATPKGRLANNRSINNSVVGQVSNPFAPQTQEQPGFGAVNGSFAFGQNQSFPPTGSNSDNPFSFAAPSSSSFTFGTNSATPNPFAGMNGGLDSATSTQQEDAMMESPQKKPQFGSSFGGASGGFSFSQPSQQPSSNGFAFGAPHSSTTKSTPLFGAVQKPEEPKANAFGQTPQSQNPFGGFGQSSSTSQAQTPSFGFGQTQQDSQPAKPTFTFGNGGFSQSISGAKSTAMEGVSSQTATAPLNFNTNQTSSSTNGGFGGFGAQKTEESKPSTPLFGAPSSSPAKPAFSFGQSVTSTEPPQSTPSPTLMPTTSAPASNPFAGLFSSIPPPAAAQSAATDAPKPIFSFAPPSQSSNSLFGTSTSASSVVNNATANSASTPFSGFSFGAKPSQPENSSDIAKATHNTPAISTSLFGANTATDQSSAAAASPSKPLFNLGSSQPSVSSNVFSPFKPMSNVSSMKSTPFGSSSSTPAAESSKSADESSEPPAKKKSLFGRRLSDEVHSNLSLTSFGQDRSSVGTEPLFGIPNKSSVSTTAGTSSETANKPSFGLFGQSNAFTPSKANESNKAPESVKTPVPPSKSSQYNPPASNLFTSSPDNTNTQTNTQNRASESQLTSQYMASTQGPTRIPGFLNGEGYKEYDSNYRLHSLNREFKARLNEIDPQRHDVDNLIRHYVAARETIGFGIGGLYTRHVAGMKRKNDDAGDDDADVPEQYKRARPSTGNTGNANATKPLFEPSGPTASALQEKSIGPLKPAVTTASAKSADLLRNMIPGTVNNLTPAQPMGSGFKPNTSNVFAPATSSPSKSNIFGSTGGEKPTPSNPSRSETSNFFRPAPTSTTPTKSPPKKPTFSMPTFGGGTGPTNMMAAFASQAAQQQKKIQEKRKAEDFDSDEDDEAEWTRQDEERQRQKKAKFEAIANTGFKPSTGSTDTSSNAKPLFSFGATTTTQSASSETPKPAFSFGAPPAESLKAPASKPLFSFSNTSSQTSSKDTARPAFAGFGTGSAGFKFGGGASANPAESPRSPAENAEDLADADGEADSERSSGQSTGADDEEADGDYNPAAETEEEDDQEHAEDDLPEDEILEDDVAEDKVTESEEEQVTEAMAAANRQNAGKSLFDRIEPNPGSKKPETPVNGEKQSTVKTEFNFGSPIKEPAKNSTFPAALFGSHIGKSTPEPPSHSPFTPNAGLPTAAKQFKPASTFSFTPTAPSTTPAPTTGASIFAGGLTRGGPVPGEGLFGSRPSTPSNADGPTPAPAFGSGVFGKSVGNTSAPPANDLFGSSMFGKSTTSAAGDHTWKPGSEIIFGTPEKSRDAPLVNVVAPSPGDQEDPGAAKPYNSLFGNKVGMSKPSQSSGSLGFSFGGPTSAPAPGYLAAAPHLLQSNNSSAVSSRASSPGLTDTESVATTDAEDEQADPQASLMDSRIGEENETCLWDSKSKALKYSMVDNKSDSKNGTMQWNTKGVGQVRILKNKTTSKTRIVFRAEPAASIILNANLLPDITYESIDQGNSGGVKLAVYEDGKIERWVLKLKTRDMGNDLTKILEENKKN